MNDKRELDKENFLFKEGLYEKVYSNNNEFSPEYPFYEWDQENQVGKYYKKVVMKVSDEEYEKLKREKLSSTKDNNNQESNINPIAKTLKFIAILIFGLGFIVGIVLGSNEIEGIYHNHDEFSFAVAFTYWAVSFISGMMFLGFAEIIQLLQDIKNKK